MSNLKALTIAVFATTCLTCVITSADAKEQNTSKSNQSSSQGISTPAEFYVVQRYQSHPLQLQVPPKPKGSDYMTFAEINNATNLLANQLEANANLKYKSNPVIVTSFQNLDNMKETSGLGRIIAENLMYELQTKKWNIIDIRLGKDILINESGEFSLSRDVKKIKETYNIGTIVTGTYTVANDNIVINARAIDINTALVVSSGQILLPISGIEYLLSNVSSIKPMHIRGEDHKDAPNIKATTTPNSQAEIKKIVEEEVKKRIDEDMAKKLSAEITWKVNEEVTKAIEAEKAKPPAVKRKITKPVEK